MNRFRSTFIHLSCVLLAIIAAADLKGQMKPQVSINNNLFEVIDVIPVDQAHGPQLPVDVTSAMNRLPVGSVIVTNKLPKPVTAIFGIWTYIDKQGNSQTRTFACDGYLVSPVQLIIRSQGAVLFSPNGCTSEAMFPRMNSGYLLGSPFSSDVERHPPSETAASVTMVIDSIIYSDGEIRGIDSRKYFKEIQRNFSDISAFLADIADAEANGKPLTVALDDIR